MCMCRADRTPKHTHIAQFSQTRTSRALGRGTDTANNESRVGRRTGARDGGGCGFGFEEQQSLDMVWAASRVRECVRDIINWHMSKMIARQEVYSACDWSDGVDDD